MVTNALVANFKVASSSRRYDKDTGRWADGPSLRVRVTCWRRLAEGVASSVMVGDPIVVTGRMYTRDWTAEDGTRRVSYELEAFAVGHDLARGRGKFTRTRANTVTSVTESAESDARVGGEPTEPVEVSTARREEFNPMFEDFPEPGEAEYDPPAQAQSSQARSSEVSSPEAPSSEADAILRAAGLAAADPSLLDEEADGAMPDGPDAGAADDAPSEESDTAGNRPGRGRRGRPRLAVPA
jgi:single-strand DNA-binding protein